MSNHRVLPLLIVALLTSPLAAQETFAKSGGVFDGISGLTFLNSREVEPKRKRPANLSWQSPSLIRRGQIGAGGLGQRGDFGGGELNVNDFKPT